ncbi:MAG TPA: tetratricopeptide repeat protein, partial [Trichormus sp.]
MNRTKHHLEIAVSVIKYTSQRDESSAMRNQIEITCMTMMLVMTLIVVCCGAYQPGCTEPSSVLADQTNKDRAEKLRKEGHYAEAANVYKEMIKAQPEDAASYFSLGSCYQELHQYNKAHTYYEKAVALKPDEKAYASALH